MACTSGKVCDCITNCVDSNMPKVIGSCLKPVIPNKAFELLPPKYGYVVLIAGGSMLVNSWMAVKVMMARSKYNAELPMMSVADNNSKFNCIVRAYQNSMESYPSFLTVLLVGGLWFPTLSAEAGFVYLISRILFAAGYYTGDPSKRVWGSWGYLPGILMLGNTLMFACQLMKSKCCPQR